ncbi:MAG: cold shock domain-containing protein [Anaerolineae bacterium]|nr:MAG: cold shock domain-containing protein [Anaerolineae bacterium]
MVQPAQRVRVHQPGARRWLFVHRSALPALTNLQPNDLVEFAVELSPKGVQAGQVVVLTTSVSS